MLTQDLAPQRWWRCSCGDGQTDVMLSICGQDPGDLGISTNGHQHDLVFTEVGDPSLHPKGGWSGWGRFGTIDSEGSGARIGLNAKQATSIFGFACDVRRPIRSYRGISHGRFKASIFREVERMAF
tara:strand:- start:501 stop:878 length:378 start_codon:yes stop_codon:yes gene_type:complete